jgi:hypothetical protein
MGFGSKYHDAVVYAFDVKRNGAARREFDSTLFKYRGEAFGDIALDDGVRLG